MALVQQLTAMARQPLERMPATPAEAAQLCQQVMAVTLISDDPQAVAACDAGALRR